MTRNASKRWTGWLHRQHFWCGRFLLLPDGEIAPLLWANRGRVLLLNYRDLEFNDYLLWARRQEKEVRLYRHPEAVLLGSQKLGVKERRSASKAAAARRNGGLPPRLGSKPRGRPRRNASLDAEASGVRGVVTPVKAHPGLNNRR